jgi:hypothetical protein
MKQLIAILALIGTISFSGLSALAVEAPQTLTFELLAQTTYSYNPPPSFPAELSKIEGQRVRISGFMLPFADTDKFEQLLLVKLPGGCYFCSAPPPTAVVFIRRLATDPPLQYTEDLISFEGVLHLWNSKMKEDDESKSFFFTIDDAKAIKSNSFLSKGVTWFRDKINGK